ncbi:hypothetical protein GCM10009789_03120 [Kribbella sancticallisti]|uniref:Gp5/Type VI secretion system Vgr protein OB-fold domain-containing protein n=1 Tax=Kribbella sancticallisti TaxID=460087 RepID=A0ABN2C626_9ACTN
MIQDARHHDPDGAWPVARFYGKYHGVVADTDDPLKIGRIRSTVPAVLGEDVQTGWALPCLPAGGAKDTGLLFLPSVGATVWMEFAAGDISQPIWSGCFYGAPTSTGGADDLGSATGPETPQSDGQDPSPTRWVLRTAGGHELTFDDDGEVVLLKNGNGKTSVRFEQDGTVVVSADTIKLGASAAEKVVLGDTFMTFFNAHTHPTGVGPSGPPVTAMSSSQLSAKVTTE